MPNRLRLTGILTPPADAAFRPGVGYVRFEPADDRAATWAVPGYRPAWPILGVPNAVGGALQEINGGDVFVPGDEPGDAHAGPWMRVSYELQTTAGTWHRGTYLWRAVSTGGGVIDIRTPAPEQEPPIVARPGVPAGALLTTDVGNLVPSKAEFDGALADRLRGQWRPMVFLDAAKGEHPDGEWVRLAETGVSLSGPGTLYASVQLAPDVHLAQGSQVEIRHEVWKDSAEIPGQKVPASLTARASYGILPAYTWTFDVGSAGLYSVITMIRSTSSNGFAIYSNGVSGFVQSIPR
jgi:hypothetical protein